MAIAISSSISIDFIPDGVGAMEVPSAQRIKLSIPMQFVPGTLNSPTAANFQTAFTALATAMGVALTTAQINQIGQWGSGGN